MILTLINVGNELSAMATRGLSAHARRLGLETRIVLVPTHLYNRQYETRTLEQVAEAVAGSDLVGLTVFTSQFGLAVQLTEAIRQRHGGLPMIWGGIHPTIRPEESLEHADAICMGEGEEVFSQLAAGRDLAAIPGIWTRRVDGGLLANGIAPMVTDLDTLPYPDFSFQGHFLIDPVTGQFEPFTPEEYQRRSDHSYHDLTGTFRCFYKTMSSRGCPYACSYCNNSVMHAMYTKKHFRKRSVEHLLGELEEVTRHHPFIGLIHLADDSFMNRSAKEIQAFSQAYQQRIRLPIRALTTPGAITREKLEALLEAGLCHLYMGIESGSPSALARYHRKIDNTTVMRSAQLLREYRQRMLTPKYDVIVNDPMASPEEERENLQFLLQIPRPRIFQFYNLLLFHGTKLREEALARGITVDDDQPYEEEYFFRPSSYYGIVTLFLNLRFFPVWGIRLLIHPRCYRWSQREGWNRLIWGVLLWWKRFETGDFPYGSLPWYGQQFKKALVTGDWGKFRRYFRRKVGPF